MYFLSLLHSLFQKLKAERQVVKLRMKECSGIKDEGCKMGYVNNDSFDVYRECSFGMMPKHFQQGEWKKKGGGGRGREMRVRFQERPVSKFSTFRKSL